MPGSATGRAGPDQGCCSTAFDAHDAYEKLDMRETPPRSVGIDEKAPDLREENDATDEREYLDICESRLETAELVYCFASANFVGALVWPSLSFSLSLNGAADGCSGPDSGRDDPVLLPAGGAEGSELGRSTRL